mgnify:CR=1 FL=1
MSEEGDAMEQEDVGEVEEVKMIIIGLRDICLYIENCNVYNISSEIFYVFNLVLKSALLLLDEYVERIEKNTESTL